MPRRHSPTARPQGGHVQRGTYGDAQSIPQLGIDGLGRIYSAGQVAITQRVSLIVAASDESTAIGAGTNKVTFRAPYGMTLTAIRASLTTAQTSGSTFTVDVNVNGSTILSTKLTLDNGEKTSTTAATPAVISNPAINDDDEITVDVDAIGDGTAKGLKITLIGTNP